MKYRKTKKEKIKKRLSKYRKTEKAGKRENFQKPNTDILVTLIKESMNSKSALTTDHFIYALYATVHCTDARLRYFIKSIIPEFRENIFFFDGKSISVQLVIRNLKKKKFLHKPCLIILKYLICQNLSVHYGD